MSNSFKNVFIRLVNSIRANHEKISCERCGVTDSNPYTATTTEATLNYQRLFGKFLYKEPLHLCFACTIAQDSFLQVLIMLSIEQTTKTGRHQAIEEAQKIWGDEAMDMLALLQVAKTSMDSARRILAEEEFNRIKPWLVETLKNNTNPQSIN